MFTPKYKLTCLAALIVCAIALCSDATDLTVANTVIGKTPTYIGFNMGHYLPGSNTSAWVQYSNANGFRFWAAASYYEPKDDDQDTTHLPAGATKGTFGDGVTSLNSFNARKAALRANPFARDAGNVPYINWDSFNYNWDNVNQGASGGRNSVKLTYTLTELNKLGVQPLLEIQRSDSSAFPVTAGNYGQMWEQWQHYYASAYHMAKDFGVTSYEMYNEPDLTSITVDNYVLRLQLASDAIHSAIADVNAATGKHLVADVSAPVLAGSTSNFDTWAPSILAKRRTDFSGAASDHDIVNTWDAHLYGSSAASNAQVGGNYVTQIQNIKTKVPQLSPAGAQTPLPIVYSEFNRYGSQAFADDSNKSLDNPRDYSELGTQLLAMTSEDIKAMYAFKFNQTQWTANGTVQPQKTGFYYVDETSTNKDTTGATHGAEVMRLFAKGFAGAKDRYGTSVPEADNSGSASSRTYVASAAYDASKNNYYVFTTNTSAAANTGTLDLSSWDVKPGTYVSIEEVSARRYGEVSQLFQVPANKKIQLTQPGQSVWLATIPRGMGTASISLSATADAQVQNSTSAGPERSRNYGSATTGSVGRSNTTLTSDFATYLKFSLAGNQPTSVQRAILQVSGKNAVDSDIASFHVYGILNDTWTEAGALGITWATAPDLSLTDAKMTNVGTDAFPVGHLTFDGTASSGMLDVTDFVRRHPDLVLSFVLVREQTFTGDVDNNRVDLSMKESGLAPQLVIFVPEPAGLGALITCVSFALTRRAQRRKGST